MSTPLVLLPVARVELADACDWYDASRPGLGAAFRAAVEVAFDRIADQPDFYAVAWGNVREAPVGRYPYRVYYREEPGRVLVLSVFHTSRDPTVWQSRA